MLSSYLHTYVSFTSSNSVLLVLILEIIGKTYYHKTFRQEHYLYYLYEFFKIF